MACSEAAYINSITVGVYLLSVGGGTGLQRAQSVIVIHLHRVGALGRQRETFGLPLQELLEDRASSDGE